MDSDILSILRDWGTRDLKSRIVETLLRDAADEIERLRAENARLLGGECSRSGPADIPALDEVADEIENLRNLLRLFVSHEPCDIDDGECVAHGWFVDGDLRCAMVAVSNAVGGCGCA